MSIFSKLLTAGIGMAAVGVGIGTGVTTDSPVAGVAAGFGAAGFMLGFRGSIGGSFTKTGSLLKTAAKDATEVAGQTAKTTAQKGSSWSVKKIATRAAVGLGIGTSHLTVPLAAAAAPTAAAIGGVAAATGGVVIGGALLVAVARNTPEFAKGFLSATKTAYKTTRAGKGGEAMEFAEQIISDYGRVRGAGAVAGTVTGSTTALGVSLAEGAGKGLAWATKGNRKNIYPALFGVGVGGAGIMMAMSTREGYGTSPANLRTQMTAITEQAAYERSPIAGMQSPMSFSSSSYAGPIPVLPSMQKARGYDANALSATGDLVLALNSLRHT